MPIFNLPSAQIVPELQLPVRRPGKIDFYTGTDGAAQGWFADVDGRWVYLSLDSIRTIGIEASGAHLVGSWLQVLYEHLWLAFDSSRCPLLSSVGSSVGRGATATSDWNASKRLTLPDYRGRVLLPAGQGGGLTNRPKNGMGGEEAHANTAAENGPHNHGGISHGATIIPGDRHLDYSGVGPMNGLSFTYSQVPGSGNPLQSHQHGINVDGAGSPHNTMQPWSAEHLCISAGVR